MMKNGKQGFTLIELMIVVAIIAILAAIAYPSYTQYKVRTNRADAQTEVIRLSHRLQAYKTINRSYADATLSNIGGSAVYPSTGSAAYNLSLAVGNDNQTYTLAATPINTSVQKGNGVFCLNQDGQRYWAKTIATAADCSAAITSNSNWDGR